MHKDWCGKPCSNCTNPCKLDKSIPCSPDCECLGANGEHASPDCQNCNAMKNYKVKIIETLVMIVDVEAQSKEEAEQIASDNWRNSEYILDADC